MNEKPPKPEKLKPEKDPLKSKKRKKLALIISGAVLTLGLIGGALYYFVFREVPPELSDAEFLVSVGTWEKSGSPKVKWIFKENGVGTLTTNNMINDYEFTWTLEDGVLKISTAWLYSLEDEFTFSLNREENSFTVVSKEDEKESIFVPTTAESSAKNTTEENAETTVP